MALHFAKPHKQLRRWRLPYNEGSTKVFLNITQWMASTTAITTTRGLSGTRRLCVSSFLALDASCLNVCLCLYRRAEGTPIYLSSHLIDRLESLNNDAWMIQYFLAHAIMRACMHAVIKPKHLWETCSLCRRHGAEYSCSADCTSTEARPLYELESLYFATPEHGE